MRLETSTHVGRRSAALILTLAALGAAWPAQAQNGPLQNLAPEGAGPAPLALSWQSTFDGIQSVPSLVLRVRAREAVKGSLELVSEGLDFRTVGRPYGAFDLKAGERRDIVVRLADVPLQGVSYSSQVAILARLTRVDGSTLTQRSPEFHAHYVDDYARALVYSGETMERVLNHGQHTSDAFDLEGRIWNGAQFEDIDDVRRREYAGDPPLQAGPHIGAGSVGPWVPTEPHGYPVEVDWKTYYLDAGHGEDYANTEGSQTLDASYAFAEIGRVVSTPCAATEPTNPCVQIVWQGYLDANGRTEVPSPAPGGAYLLWLYSTMKKGSTTAEVNHWSDPTWNTGLRRWRLSFQVPSGIGPVQAKLSTTWHRTANAAAVMSRLFQVEGIASASGDVYRVHSNKACTSTSSDIPADDACARGGSLYTGPWIRSVDGEPGSLQFKYVLAHEAGHAAMHNGPGNPANDYYASQPMNLCKCNHVLASNRLHCLQSAEYMSTAQVEGFAHYVAARLFNRTSDADCSFNYYKEFLPLFGPVKAPPVRVSCIDPASWRDRYCGYDKMGTEYDWMQFYWNVSRGLNATGVAALYDIYEEACGGPCTSDSSGNPVNVTWNMLVLAAISHYGNALDPRVDKFATVGDTCGVDATP